MKDPSDKKNDIDQNRDEQHEIKQDAKNMKSSSAPSYLPCSIQYRLWWY
ncbi:hypothetical protein KCQ59_15280 [Bacillus australimaris]|uniref:Uncharacterized protein n=1 Tax=Bacillus australimaris TaxID=1326968 RepID=A0ABD4QNR3_9BACI|nr:hypothetical protein [Bacillus australimaris]MBR8691152.1 hypothetical protein [Bacillus australimaris]